MVLYSPPFADHRASRVQGRRSNTAPGRSVGLEFQPNSELPRFVERHPHYDTRVADIPHHLNPLA